MTPITIEGLKVCEKYEMAFLFGKPIVLSYARITRDSLPEGFYAYDVRHSDEDWGEPVEISENQVICNYFGTIITNKKLDIDFNENDVIVVCDDDNYDIDYMEGFNAEFIEMDPEDNEDNYAWTLEEYIQRSTDPEYRDMPYEIPEGRILSKHGNTETQKDQDTEDS